MKKILSFVFAVSCSYSFSQTTVTVRENTQIFFVNTATIHEKEYSTTTSAPFVVADDVVVKGKVVIKKGTPAKATAGRVIQPNGKVDKGGLKAEIFETKAVDGTVIKIGDCWLATTSEQPHPKKDADGEKVKKGAAFLKGTRKSCATTGKYEIKVD